MRGRDADGNVIETVAEPFSMPATITATCQFIEVNIAPFTIDLSIIGAHLSSRGADVELTAEELGPGSPLCAVANQLAHAPSSGDDPATTLNRLLALLY